MCKFVLQTITMKKAIYSLLFLAVFYLAPAQVAERYPYIQSPDQHSVIIAWNNATSGIGSVHWGTDSNSMTNVVSDVSATQLHALTVTGLQPNTQYFYQASSGTFQSAKEYFFTAKPNDVRQLDFLVYGDCGFNNSQQDNIATQMATHPVDFGLVVGDVDQITGNNYDVNYFPHYKSMTKHTCHFTAIGNHDTLTNQTNYTNQFYLPHNNPANTELYYSFTWGNAKYIALDGNINCDAGSPQYIWLENELKCNNSEWTFIFFHQPPWTNAWDISYSIPFQYWYQYSGNVDMRTSLVPLFEQYHVDGVLNGHAHDYQRGVYHGVHYFIAGGGGTSTPDTHKNSNSPNIQYEQDLNNFMKFSIRGDTVSYYAYTLNGAAIDSGSFTKTYVPYSATITSQDVTCGNTNNGTATVIANGPRPPYTFNWNTGNNTDSISQLNAGTYYVTITDTSGCLAYDSVSISISGSISHQQISSGISGLTANVSASQSNAGTYTWVMGDGTTLTDTSSSISYTYASSGTYTVQLITVEGCGSDTSLATVTVVGDSTVGILHVAGNTLGISVFPNPFSGQTYLNVVSSEKQEFTATLFDLNGRQIKTMNGITGNTILIPADGMAAGIYILHVNAKTGNETLKLTVQ